MTWEWKIGDPVDDATGGSMDAQNWRGNRYTSNDNDESESYYSKSDEYSKKAWDLYNDYKDEEALHYINLALDLNDRNSNNWNIKGIILENLKRFEESLDCYDRSLQLKQSNTVYDNKARMLLRWSARLLEESKELPNGLNMLEKAREKIQKAIDTLPGENSKENLDQYTYQKDKIDFYIGYERKFQESLEILKAYDKYELFTITGTDIYQNVRMLTPDTPLKLIKEKDNEFDDDAIGVYVGDEKVGYVANSDHTKYELTASASELQDRIPDICEGQYLFYLERYSPIQFHVARII